MQGNNNDQSAQYEREHRILDVASRLITHYGYDKTTVSDIAREAGVSKGAIYLHWKSKSALFEALLFRVTVRYLEDWLARVETDPEGGTMSGIYKNALLALRADPLLMALYGRDLRVLGNYVSEKPELMEQKFSSRVPLLKVMQDAGIVRADIDIKAIGHLLNVITYGLMKIDEVIPPEEAPPFMDVMEAMVTMLNQALAPEGGGDSETGKQIVRQIVEMYKKGMQPTGAN